MHCMYCHTATSGSNKSLPGDLPAFTASVEYPTQYPDKVLLLFTPLLIHC